MRSTPFGGALVTPAISKLDVATELPSNLWPVLSYLIVKVFFDAFFIFV
ncbi:MAG: hypothetical protein WA087_02040 [Candidatus Saccharimonadales bacterium]